MKFLDKAQAEGKIVNQGFSFHGSLKTFREIVDANYWAMCQIQYNILDENLQAGTAGLKYASSKKLAVMVMEPLRGGALACDPPREVKQIYDKTEKRLSPAEGALRWVWNHPEVTVVLSGMNDEKQIVENIRTAETALPNSLKADELSVIGNVAKAYRRLTKIPCTGCQYCMPCPSGVNIPGSFQIYNDMCMFGDEQKTRSKYAMILMGGLHGKRSDPALCQDCKTCVERCAQHIDIPQQLKQVVENIGGPETEAIFARQKSAQLQKPAKPIREKP